MSTRWNRSAAWRRPAGQQFKDEIVPMKTRMKVVDKATKAESIVDYVVDRDECNRPDTTMEGLASSSR
jgi:acetyl-CoA acetyltransferase